MTKKPPSIITHISRLTKTSSKALSTNTDGAINTTSTVFHEKCNPHRLLTASFALYIIQNSKLKGFTRGHRHLYIGFIFLLKVLWFELTEYEYYCHDNEKMANAILKIIYILLSSISLLTINKPLSIDNKIVDNTSDINSSNIDLPVKGGHDIQDNNKHFTLCLLKKRSRAPWLYHKFLKIMDYAIQVLPDDVYRQPLSEMLTHVLQNNLGYAVMRHDNLWYFHNIDSSHFKLIEQGNRINCSKMKHLQIPSILLRPRKRKSSIKSPNRQIEQQQQQQQQQQQPRQESPPPTPSSDGQSEGGSNSSEGGLFGTDSGSTISSSTTPIMTIDRQSDVKNIHNIYTQSLHKHRTYLDSEYGFSNLNDDHPYKFSLWCEWSVDHLDEKDEYSRLSLLLKHMELINEYLAQSMSVDKVSIGIKTLCKYMISFNKNRQDIINSKCFKDLLVKYAYLIDIYNIEHSEEIDMNIGNAKNINFTSILNNMFILYKISFKDIPKWFKKISISFTCQWPNDIGSIYILLKIIVTNDDELIENIHLYFELINHNNLHKLSFMAMCFISSYVSLNTHLCKTFKKCSDLAENAIIQLKNTLFIEDVHHRDLNNKVKSFLLKRDVVDQYILTSFKDCSMICNLFTK